METGSTPETASNQPVSAKEDKKKPRKPHAVLEWVITLAAAFLVAWFVRSTIIEPFVVIGASMDPTFATGQFLLVDRISYHFTAPARDDVIVFQYPDPDPQDAKQDYIKRIIGLPGEEVIIKDGAVSIEKTASSTPILLDEPYVEASHASHDDLSVQLGPDQYFVMGDNRIESSDSRAWGPLPAQNIIGRPALRLTPLYDLAFMPGAYHNPSNQ